MRPHEEAALATIRAAYEEPVIYTGAGLMAAPVMAIFSDASAAAFLGPGDTARSDSFEIAKSALPERPRKENTIQQGETTWSVIDITERNDVEAWVLVVEEAPAP